MTETKATPTPGNQAAADAVSKAQGVTPAHGGPSTSVPTSAPATTPTPAHAPASTPSPSPAPSPAPTPATPTPAPTPATPTPAHAPAPSSPSQTSAALAMNELDRHYVDRVLADRAKVAADGEAKAKAVAEGRTFITDFAGSVNGPFGVYGVNLNKGGQLTINGQVPQVTLIRADVIKGILAAPGLDLKPGPVTVRLGTVEFRGTL